MYSEEYKELCDSCDRSNGIYRFSVNIDNEIIDYCVPSLEEFCIENGYKPVFGSFTITDESGDTFSLPKIVFVKDPKSLDVVDLFKRYTSIKKENMRLSLKVKELEEIEHKYNILKEKIEKLL